MGARRRLAHRGVLEVARPRDAGAVLFSWSIQWIAGWYANNVDPLAEKTGLFGYFLSSDFWNRSLQNWQYEFLAIASMAILSVYLRQRGSPESKPVGAAHSVSDKSG